MKCAYCEKPVIKNEAEDHEPSDCATCSHTVCRTETNDNHECKKCADTTDEIVSILTNQ